MGMNEFSGRWPLHSSLWSNAALPMDTSVVRTMFKCLTLLFILTVGDPDIIDAIVMWLGRA